MLHGPRPNFPDPNPSQDLPVTHAPVRRFPIVFTSASWLSNLLAFFFMCMWVGGSRLLPGGLDLWSNIPDDLIRAAFFAAFGCAVLAAVLGKFALRCYRGPYADAPGVSLAGTSFLAGEALAILHAAGLCLFLYLFAFCGQHC